MTGAFLPMKRVKNMNNELNFLIYNTPEEKAKAEYEAFNKTQKISSDFDKQVKNFLKKGGGKNE